MSVTIISSVKLAPITPMQIFAQQQASEWIATHTLQDIATAYEEGKNFAFHRLVAWLVDHGHNRRPAGPNGKRIALPEIVALGASQNATRKYFTNIDRLLWLATAKGFDPMLFGTFENLSSALSKKDKEEVQSTGFNAADADGAETGAADADGAETGAADADGAETGAADAENAAAAAAEMLRLRAFHSEMLELNRREKATIKQFRELCIKYA